MRLVKPKKFLGQHFLKDLKVAQDIANTVDACPESSDIGSRTGYGSADAISPCPKDAQ